MKPYLNTKKSILLLATLPLLDVYNRAAWKQAVRMLCKGSSMLTCIPKPASGLIFGRESKSVERTKKLPWKLVMVKPLVALKERKFLSTYI